MELHKETEVLGIDLSGMPQDGVGWKQGSVPTLQSDDCDRRELDREQVLVSNLPLVRFVARRIYERLPKHVDLEELVSAGVLGLMDAVQRFDSTRQVQFRSYAQFRIRGAILDSLRSMDWSPRDLRRKGRSIEQNTHSLTSKLGRAPLDIEIAEEIGVSLEEYQQVLGELRSVEIGSLNVERSADSGEEELACVPAPASDDPFLLCLQSELRDRLAHAIDLLPEKERLVLTLRYHEELTMKEIALVLGVVESRVSQIHSSAVSHLRSTLDGSAKKIGRGAKAHPRH